MDVSNRQLLSEKCTNVIVVEHLALILRREFEKRLKPVQIEVGHALRDMTGWTILREFLGSIRFSRLPVCSDILFAAYMGFNSD